MNPQSDTQGVKRDLVVDLAELMEMLAEMSAAIESPLMRKEDRIPAMLAGVTGVVKGLVGVLHAHVTGGDIDMELWLKGRL